jgi:hypothetical protein
MICIWQVTIIKGNCETTNVVRPQTMINILNTDNIDTRYAHTISQMDNRYTAHISTVKPSNFFFGILLN